MTLIQGETVNALGTTVHQIAAPDVLVQEVVAKLRSLGGTEPQELTGREENIVFSLPKELRLVDVSE